MLQVIRAGFFLAPVLLASGEGAADTQVEYIQPVETITVVAHRQPRQRSEVAGTVTIIDPDRLERDMVVDLTDLVRYEPGVEVDTGGTRFGFGGFRIRGVGGNRTAVVIDNVPAADRFTVGQFADTGRGLMELGLVSRAEILRGPASTLYGSKALGGVVAFRLIDVDDLLESGRRGTRAGLSGATDSDRMQMNAASAWKEGRYDFLVAGAALRGSQVNVAHRPEETPVDDLNRQQAALLLRAGMDTAAGRLRLTLDGMSENRDSDTRAMIGSGRLAFTESLRGDDRREQWRALLDQEVERLGPVSRGHWRLWHQQTRSRQETSDLRPNAPVPVDILRRFEFRQETTGVGIDLESTIAGGGMDHRLGYGLELSQSRVTSQRDGRQTNLDTGETTHVLIGEVFPLRDFPVSVVTDLGVYLHDEVRLWHRGPTLSPGLRFEYYDLATRRDLLFETSFPNAEITELSTTAWLPKLGLLWPLNEHTELFAQYAHGFRAPPFDDVNIGLELAQFRVRALPNPDLKPERGRTTEARLRRRGQRTQVELALFRNDYRDFIQSRAPLGLDPDSDLLLFQSINRDNVRIEGTELRLAQELGAGFNTELSAEWTRGSDRDSGRALPEISPARLIAELGWIAPSHQWESRLVLSAVRAQRRLEDESGQTLFSPPGHASIDLLTRWYPQPNLTLGVGLFNLTDRQYWRAAGVIGRPSGDPTLPLLAEPGRSLMISLHWRRSR